MHLEGDDLLDPHQTAYKKGFSIQTALIRFLDDVRSAADHRRVTVAVFFDFTKAFDRVNHNKLICKLRQLHFSCALRWMCAYLSQRKQAVREQSSGRISAVRTVTGRSASGLRPGSASVCVVPVRFQGRTQALQVLFLR